jgi:hypothetical protein
MYYVSQNLMLRQASYKRQLQHAHVPAWPSPSAQCAVGSSQRMRSTHTKFGLCCAILCSSYELSKVVFCMPCATAYLHRYKDTQTGMIQPHRSIVATGTTCTFTDRFQCRSPAGQHPARVSQLALRADTIEANWSPAGCFSARPKRHNWGALLAEAAMLT